MQSNQKQDLQIHLEVNSEYKNSKLLLFQQKAQLLDLIRSKRRNI